MRDQQDDHLQLGKGRSYFVKSQLKRLRQEDDIWEADFFPVPQQGLWIGLVISHTDDFVLAHETIEEPPTVNDLARLLAEAMRRPLVEFSHRPRSLYQIAMGWEFEHLYRFEVGGVEFSDVESDMDDEVQDVRAFKLSEVIPASHRRPRFSYEYDFGDGWRHQLIVEEQFEPRAGVAYPVCIAGARACPPEDCSGPWGYADFIEAIQNPKHNRHEELLEWVGGEFDPEGFELEAVNKELAKIC